MMIPPPRPVPMVRKIILLQPRPAPKRHSARAQAFASFIRNAGTLNSFPIISIIRMLSQPGRFGGDITTPRRASSGPPQLTPNAAIPCSDRLFFRSSSWVCSTNSVHTALKPFEPDFVKKKDKKIGPNYSLIFFGMILYSMAFII